MTKKFAVALATTVALAGAGITVPQTMAETTETTTVEGLSWPVGKVTAGGKTTIAPNQTPAGDLRFGGGAHDDGYAITVDEKTGVVAVEAPLNAPPGYQLTIPVTVSKGDTEVGTYKVVAAIVEGGNAATYSPGYDDIAVPQGQTATATLKGNVPAGTKFDVAASPIFSTSVDKQGKVSITPIRNVGAGTSAVIRVTITYPDSSIEYQDINVVVTQPRAATATPKPSTPQPTKAPTATVVPRTTIPGPTPTRTGVSSTFATTIEFTVTNGQSATGSTPGSTTKATEPTVAGTTEPSASNGSSTGEAIAIVLTSLAVLGGMAALLGWWALESGIITL